MFTLGEIARILGGRLIGEPDLAPRRVIHDSRLVAEGDLFVALPGAEADGHRFVSEALANGGCGAIVSRPVDGENLIVVGDTPAALRTLASAWRDRLKGEIIAVTGSNGKTTTRDLLAHLLSAKFRTYSSPANYNTEIGLPLALLSMAEEDEVGVFELATAAPGEIGSLARLLRPTAGIITGVGPSHLGSFGTLAAVAEEKWSLARTLPEGSLIVVNGDSEHLRTRAGGGVLTVGIEHGALRGRILREAPRLTVEIPSPPMILDLPLLGSHNATNALLAAACALRLGIRPEEIAARGSTFAPREHRLRPIATRFGTILDDTYNANPASTIAALRVLSRFGGEDARRIFVFGEMLDLGKESGAYHRRVVEEALKLEIDAILPVGELPEEACRASGADRAVFPPRGGLVSRIEGELSEGENVVLVKGSRALALEETVERLRRIGS